MTIRLLTCLCVLACLVLPGVGRAQNGQPAGAIAGQDPAGPDLSYAVAAEPVAVGPVEPAGSRQMLRWTVRLWNVSSKPVTAYRISVEFAYSDGTSATEGWTEDLLPTIALSGVPGAAPIPNSTFNPGESHTFTQWLDPDAGKPVPVKGVAHVVMVLFADRTGLGDPKLVSSLFVSRRLTSDNIANLVAAVREAEASPHPVDRYREMIATSHAQPLGQGPFGPYAKRLEKYLAVRGTWEHDLMLKLDDAVRDRLMEQSVPAGGQLQ